ncbi:MAG: hypothetical protein SV375_16300, partial [Thermodesulfobacteriota bacterium]|nr:hypothetical protein [Thermodesulfobacteriota bacterium]
DKITFPGYHLNFLHHAPYVLSKGAGIHGHRSTYCSRKGDLVTRNGSTINFAYREPSLEKGSVIFKALFQLDNESPDIIARKMADYLRKRREKQPFTYPSGGSVFKNPPNDYAGRLIEMAGLKGKKIGGAMISPKHANFIVNTGGARAEDILSLIDLARRKVKEKTGMELELEIQVAGS